MTSGWDKFYNPLRRTWNLVETIARKVIIVPVPVNFCSLQLNLHGVLFLPPKSQTVRFMEKPNLHLFNLVEQVL